VGDGADRLHRYGHERDGLHHVIDFDRNGDGMVDSDEGQTVVVGGVDATTGLPLTSPLIAPRGCFVVSSLSTLMASLVNDHGFSLEDAQQRVREALGLPEVDLTHFNVLAETAAGHPDAPAVMAAIAKLEDTIAQTANLVSSVPNAPPVAMAAELVVADIAGKIVEPESAFDLSNAVLLETVIYGVLEQTGLEFDASIVSGAATVIAAGNQHIDAIPLSADTEFLAQVAQTQVVAQGSVAKQLAYVAQGQANIDDVIESNTGVALELQIAAAVVGNVVVPELVVSDARIVENDGGTAMMEFTVTLSAIPAEPVSVDYTTWDGSATAGSDYQTTTGTLTWNAGNNTPQTIQIPVSGDAVFEPDEEFLVVLTNPVGAAVWKSRGTGTVANDDPLQYTALSSDGQPNDLRLLIDGSYLALQQNGEIVVDGQFSAPIPISIIGADGVQNSLRLDLVSASEVLNGGIYFQGGQSSGDSLVIDDSVAQTVQHTITGDGSGTFTVDGVQISYTGAESVADRFAPAVTGFPATSLEGSEISLHASPPDPFPVYTYDWSVTKDGVPYATGADADLRFTPNDGGHYVVNLTISAEGRSTATTSSTVMVTPVNDAPVAADSSMDTAEDTPVSGSLSALDIDGDALAYSLVDGPSHGPVTLNSDGSFTYTPSANFHGMDTFTYKASDGLLDSNVATVTITVNNLVDLSGRVFDDLDNDGVLDAGEPGLEGVEVRLFREDTTATEPAAIVTTNALGDYVFDVNLRPGRYRLEENQPDGLLDGMETPGGLGGAFDNDHDSSAIWDIEVVEGSPDAGDYLFADIRPSRLQGMVWEDFNDDGEVNFGEEAIEGVLIRLTGTDDRNAAVDVVMATDAQGIFEFTDLRPGSYTLAQTQPAGFPDGKDSLGAVNGVPVGNAVVNDRFSGVTLPLPGSDGVNYNFGERPPAGGDVTAGQTATIGFWQNKHGQALINALNGGPASTQLGNWLAASFPEMYGVNAGPNNLSGMTNGQVAELYKSLFKRTARTCPGGPPKLDAQVLATALAVYVTNENLAGTTAASYGFRVTDDGVGVSTIDISYLEQLVFGLDVPQENHCWWWRGRTTVTVMDLLLATDERTHNGLLFDLDGNGTINWLETIYRVIANQVYESINERGHI
jgi:hypothetical protein